MRVYHQEVHWCCPYPVRSCRSDHRDVRVGLEPVKGALRQLGINCGQSSTVGLNQGRQEPCGVSVPSSCLKDHRRLELLCPFLQEGIGRDEVLGELWNTLHLVWGGNGAWHAKHSLFSLRSHFPRFFAWGHQIHPGYLG